MRRAKRAPGAKLVFRANAVKPGLKAPRASRAAKVSRVSRANAGWSAPKALRACRAIKVPRVDTVNEGNRVNSAKPVRPGPRVSKAFRVLRENVEQPARGAQLVPVAKPVLAVKRARRACRD